MARESSSAVEPAGIPSVTALASRRLTGFQIAVLIGSLLVGVAIGLALLAQIFVRVPTDVRRLGILHQAMQTAEPPPEVAAFGNSVMMSGVDGRALTSLLPESPVAWNCASTGQTLLESYLLSQDLPDTVGVAVYGIFAQPDHDVEPLNAQKYNTLFMYGFRPKAATIETVARIFDADTLEILERSPLAQVFASRWAIRQFVDTRARSLLRSDLALDKATFDLFHPQSYTQAIDPEITQSFVAKRLAEFAKAPAVLGSGTIELAHQIAREADAAGRRTIFLFPPLHPDVLETAGPRLLAVQQEFQAALGGAPGVRILDAAELLDRTQFIDDLHPSNAGAAILSEYLADAIREMR